MMGNKKLQVWLPLLFSLVLIMGMYLGYKLNGAGKNDLFASNKRSSLQEAVDLIRLKYVDSINIDSLEGRAIEEMMTVLDPHSVYLPPVDLKEANEDLEGKFEGIGVEFNIFRDTVNVVYVIPGGPSEKAGLLIGDKIIKVNDSSLTGKSWDVDAIKNYIRGPGGSKAHLQVLRGGQSKSLTVTRGTIPVLSVDAGYMLDKQTGYIRLNKFTGNSYREFMRTLETLKSQGLVNLVFDLRGNGGGFMEEAVEMADEFLDGEKLVVYMQGVNEKRREYRCKRPGMLEKGKIVLLVDELSASASEVLAGSLQDWCRAKVVGRRTFGKGLVQRQFPLSDGGALRLTIARYYTPLGRSIQRSYENGRKVYMDELWDRFNSGEMFSLDSLRNNNTGKKFLSSCKDTLYDGDGITPDIFVPADTSAYRQRVNEWLSHIQFRQFVHDYYLAHTPELGKFKTATDFNSGLSAEKLWNDFVKSIAGDTLNAAKLNVREKEILQLRMKAILARYRWRNTGYFEVLNANDPFIRKALETIAN
jgi:carboxyl-terminal processing protease